MRIGGYHLWTFIGRRCGGRPEERRSYNNNGLLDHLTSSDKVNPDRWRRKYGLALKRLVSSLHGVLPSGSGTLRMPLTIGLVAVCAAACACNDHVKLYNNKLRTIQRT